MAWRRRAPARPTEPHLPDAQNVITRLDAVVDRLEGAYEQWQRLEPLLKEYADSLTGRGGG